MITMLLLLLPLQERPRPEVMTATTHPMKYHVSLPEGWSKDKPWPVVIAVPDAHRDFPGNLAAFVKARRSKPYIVVVPHVVTSGGTNYRLASTYQYTNAEWDKVKQAGDYRFDEEGIIAILADVRKLYNGEGRCYLTGWEAGGHTVWALTFRHPEWFHAVAPVSTNYQGRWLDARAFSTAQARHSLPVRVLSCEESAAPQGWKFFMAQTKDAIKVAADHGFRTPELKSVPGKPHGPLAEEVLEFFDAIRTGGSR